VLVVVVESPTAVAPFELKFEADEHISIGRDPKSRVQLPDASVSLRHALIRPSSNGYVIIDESSTNGTYLNASRLVPGAAKLLSDGDRVQIGRARLSVRFRTPSTAPKTAFSTQDIALAMVQGTLIQAGSAVAPRLSVIRGPDRGLELILREERSYVLGRDDDADLRLSDEDASRRHTRVVRRGSRLWVIDLGSKNGTRLDGRRLRPNVAEAWTDMAVLELGRNQFGIDDPVSSALRSLERVPDERLGSSWLSAKSRAMTPGSAPAGSGPTHPVSGSTARIAALADGRTGHTSVNEAKGVLSLSTSSSSSAPSAPIEVVPFRESEPPRRAESRKSSWSALDALVVGVAVLTIVLSALALAWFLVS
jgi:pSer/pThr/pTyr-binding forkhead associated (FHA) protein